MDVQVREQKLPGVGRLYQLPLDDGWAVSVAVDDRSGERELGILGPGHDSPRAQVHLSEAHSATLGALLSGIHFVFDREPGHERVDGVQVETVAIGAGSPAAGLKVDEVDVPDPSGARILAVIRDDTPELIEDEADRPCRPGDRLVLAGLPGALQDLRRFLAG